MRSTTLAPLALFLTPILAQSSPNFYVSFYSDRYCQNLTSSPDPYDTSSCHQLAAGAGSFKADLSNFTSAYWQASAYMDADCQEACNAVTILNEGPSADYPIANGQCVAAPPVGSGNTWGSWRTSTYR